MRGVILEDTYFDNVRLKGAIIYDGFIYDKSKYSPHSLVELYFELISYGSYYDVRQCVEEAEKLYRKGKTLKHLYRFS